MAREQPLGSNGAEGPTQAIRRISVVAPLLNEASHVDGLVADLAGQDFTGELDVIVADGGSSDGSVERLRAAAEQHRLSLTILENPARWVSQGLNACIRRARGDLIVRVDCHARYPRDYLRRCAIAAEETDAWNVGGVVVADGRTPMERAVRVRWIVRSGASAGRGMRAARRGCRWTPSPTGRSGPRHSTGQACSTRRSSATRTTSSTCVYGDRAVP